MHEQTQSTVPGLVGGFSAMLAGLRQLAIRSLRRMYRADRRLFAFRLRRQHGLDVLEGVSPRYTAIVLIGLAGESQDAAGEVLGRHSVGDVLDHLTDVSEASIDLGEVALALWAAGAHRHGGGARLLKRLLQMRPDRAPYPTVEVAWSLSALAAPGNVLDQSGLAEPIADRLLRSIHPRSGLFPHRPAGVPSSRLRGHVACFADQVYPLQALAYYCKATGSLSAGESARTGARQICALQGPAGQWWWHYDVRTGRVLERYPVYSIHQDAMGPMSLFDVAECCGGDYSEAVERSMRWLLEPPEVQGSLVDQDADVIWRKVARREPRKLVRRLQAGLSRIHPACRVPKAELLFPATAIDYETRPYHMGWLLYAWSPARLRQPWVQRTPEYQKSAPFVRRAASA